MSFTFDIKKEPVADEACSSASNSASLIQYEFVNCGLLDGCHNTAESNYETGLPLLIKTEPASSEHDPLDTNTVPVKEEDLHIHNGHTPFENEAGDVNYTSITDPIKTEPVSPRPDGSDELDIEYNIDIEKEFKLQKSEMCYAPNIRNTERTLGQRQDLQIAIYSDTNVNRPDQKTDSPGVCLIGGDPITNARVKPFSCNICNLSFAQKAHLLRHMHTHTGEKPFSCDTCKKSFARNEDLLRHNQTHTGERPFTCDVCKKSFTQKTNLFTHIRTHTGEKPFSCHICKLSFTQKPSLMGHMRTHTGEKPFSCEICKRSFARNQNLLRHMRTHTQEKRFLCNAEEHNVSEFKF